MGFAGAGDYLSAGSFLAGTVQGDKALIKGLSTLPGNIQRRVMRNAVRKAMTPVSMGAKKSIQADINTNRDPGYQPMWGRAKNIVNPAYNRAARIAKLKVLRKSINTVVRTSSNYSSKGNTVAVVGKRYGDRFPEDADIPKSLHNQYINPFARKWEYHGNSYIRATFIKEKDKILAIMRDEVKAGLERETRRAFRQALKDF